MLQCFWQHLYEDGAELTDGDAFKASTVAAPAVYMQTYRRLSIPHEYLGADLGTC